ncbi:MAG: YbaK/EbsC family protein [Firmicutes bacterium]|nr:YbaK/EbsC family protein [Bacillota bacterium]
MSVERVRKFFAQYGMEDRVMEFDVSSATVDLAAEAVGVEGARICKTISFKRKDGGCNLIQMAGDARVDNKKYKAQFGEKGSFLSHEEALEYTGYAVGGVCAFDIQNENVTIYCDESMKRFDTVFPACGSSNSAIELTLDELYKYSNAIAWVDVTKLPE